MNYKILYSAFIVGILMNGISLYGMESKSSASTLEEKFSEQYTIPEKAVVIVFNDAINNRYKDFSPNAQYYITMPEFQSNQFSAEKTKKYNSVQQFYEALKKYGTLHVFFTKEEYYDQLYNALVQKFVYAQRADFLQRLLNGMETECLQGNLTPAAPTKEQCSELVLVYRSDDTLLGINEDGIGANWIGQMIMQIRKDLPNLIAIKERAQTQAKLDEAERVRREHNRGQEAENKVYGKLDRWFGMSTFIDKFQQLPHIVQEEYFRLLALTHWLYQKVMFRTNVLHEEPSIVEPSTRIKTMPS